MLVNEVQKALTYIRETQEIALFATMADARWYSAFGASPLFFVILPFIGILLTINALINAYKLVKASNKNLDQWSTLIISAICAVLGSVSLYGAALSAFIGFSFTAGPWFFLSSLIVAFTHQVIMMGINFYRAYESVTGSAQRMHFMQAALNNLFVLGILSAALGAVIFVMLLPTVAPVLGVSCAMTAAGCTLVDILWHMVPHNWKQAIKAGLYLGKPDVTENNKSQLQPACGVEQAKEATLEVNPNAHRLFTRFEYSNLVRDLDVAHASAYLTQMILRKIEAYGTKDAALRDEKTQNKLAVLNYLYDVVQGKTETQVSKRAILVKYPLAFQSFWVEKGDVEQLCDAVIVFQQKCILPPEQVLQEDIIPRFV